MADVSANIQLTATGGDESAAEINKATQALGNVANASSAMQAKFQERFQHIGLMLFAGDALKASGLGMEARQVINTLNMAITAGGAAAGGALASFLPLITAMASLAAIAVVVAEHMNPSIESLNKQVESLDQDRQAHQSNIDKLNEYKAVVGTLPPLYQAWLNSETALREEGIKSEEAAIRSEITALQAHIAAMNASLPVAEIMRQTFKSVWDTLTGMSTASMHAATALGNQLAPNAKKASDELLKTQNQINALMVQLDELKNHHGQDLKAMGDDIKTYYENRIDALRASLDKEAFMEKNNADLIKQYNKELYSAISADEKKTAEEHKKSLEQFQSQAKHVAEQLGSDFGNAFAKMIVEGKSFSDEMKAAFTNMAEQIIADIVRIITEWAILTALGFPVGGGVPFTNVFGGAAIGGSFYADTPTPVIFGEGGPEVATFTPLSGGGGNASPMGGGSYNFGNINVSVSGVNDPNEIASQVGRAIIQQIRGQGQINFTRTA